MSAEEKQQAGRNDVLDSITFAAFDLDGRIFRTLWHSLVRTPDVALAAVKGDFSRYLSPVRVFIALFGFQFVVAALFGAPLTLTLEQLAGHLEPDEVAGWLATGRTAEGGVPSTFEIERALESWGSAMQWPITIVGSLPYLLLLKLYRPRIPLWGHLQFYLVPVNASFILMFGALALLALGVGWYLVGQVAALLVYFACTGWLVARFYSHSILGAALRMTGLFALLPLVLIITVVCQLGSTHLTLDLNFDLSLVDLFLLDND